VRKTKGSTPGRGPTVKIPQGGIRKEPACRGDLWWGGEAKGLPSCERWGVGKM